MINKHSVLHRRPIAPSRMRQLTPALLLCGLAVGIPSAPASARGVQAEVGCTAPQPVKKKGLGLGGLFAAAKRAGVGDMLTGRTGSLFGSGKGGQVLGAVAGTALQGAEGGGSGGGVAGALGGLAGQGRAAQLAGAVTGMAVEAAQSAAAPANCN